MSPNLMSENLNLIMKYEYVSTLFYVSGRTNLTVGVKEQAQPFRAHDDDEHVSCSALSRHSRGSDFLLLYVTTPAEGFV